MFIACKVATGYDLSASSPGDAYRSYAAQEYVFRQRYTDSYLPLRNTLSSQRIWNGVTWYKRVSVAAVAVPGTSNHGLGIALDVAIWNGAKIVSITAISGVWAWVQANAVSFGLSWESQAEPWHLRLTVGDNPTQRVLDMEAFFAGPPAPPVVQLGSTGPLARAVQEIIKKVSDASIIVDGNFGPRSVYSWNNFAAWFQLSVDSAVNAAPDWNTLAWTDGGWDRLYAAGYPRP